MSLFGINYTINDLELSGLQILYDFSSFSAGGTCINSVESGNSIYSGLVVNSSSQFTGNNSGSGYFTDQYIEIQNVTGITSTECTIMFSQQKTGVGAGTIFSNFDAPSGFELGITDSNKFYYKNIISGSENYVTLGDYPCDKNLYAFTMGANGGGVLNRLDFRQPESTPFALDFLNAGNVVDGQGGNPKYYNFSKTDILVPSYTVSNGANWKIGSGEFLYQGYIDYFLYFDAFLGTDVLRRIARSIHSESSLSGATTGEVSGTVTGYNVNTTGVSGEISTEFSISGTKTPSGNYFFPSGTPVTGAVGVSGTVFVPQKQVSSIVGSDLTEQTVYRRITNLSFTHTLTGGMEIGTLDNYYSSGSYWEFSGNSGTYEGVEGLGAAGTIVGITGFDVATLSGSVEGIGIPVIESSGVSGAFYSGFELTPLYEPNLIYTGSGAYVDFGTDSDPSYFPSALSIIGPPDPLFFYEILYDISGSQSLNNIGANNYNSNFYKYTAMMTGVFDSSGINLAINGVSQFTGELITSTNEFNFPTAVVTSGFDVVLSELFTTLELTPTSEIFYDNVDYRARDHLTISNTSQYASAPFSQITETNNQIYFNGVKINEGVDYTFAGGFRPQGDVLQSTGVYFTIPEYSGDPTLQSASGYLTDAITVYGEGITPDGYVLYFNGIRQPVDDILEHASKSDLITGTDINNASKTIYRMINGITQNDL